VAVRARDLGAAPLRACSRARRERGRIRERPWRACSRDSRDRLAQIEVDAASAADGSALDERRDARVELGPKPISNSAPSGRAISSRTTSPILPAHAPHHLDRPATERERVIRRAPFRAPTTAPARRARSVIAFQSKSASNGSGFFTAGRPASCESR
jgi:hypothetical protein